MSEDELLLEIGDALQEESAHMLTPSPAELKEMATDWVSEHMPKFRSLLCPNNDVKRYQENDEQKLLFHAVCEVLVHVSTGVPAGCVAAYIIKKGRAWLCQDFSESE